MTAGILRVGQPDIGFRVRVWGLGISGSGSKSLGFREIMRDYGSLYQGLYRGISSRGCLCMDFAF